MKGTTTLVTGASSGIGLELAREISRRGGNLVAGARNPRVLDALVAEASERICAVKLDVTSQEDVDAAVAIAVNRFGAIDYLVNNAGYGFLSTIEEADGDQIRDQFEVNLFGPIRLMRAVIPVMRAQRRGMVVNISSTAGARGLPASGYYCASKSALEALTESLAHEAAPLGIRAMIVCPGPTRTDFFARSMQTPRRELADYGAWARHRSEMRNDMAFQRGDPVRGARIIVDVMLSENPPMRLPLGETAFRNSIQACETRMADIARSEDLAPRADFPSDETEIAP